MFPANHLPNSSKYPRVSIIITTKNEEKNIENCLLSINAQTYPAQFIETIVIDNSSTDLTKEISLKYTNLVYDKGPERSAQRNHGILKVASGIYVIFLDADMILSPDLIERCQEFIESNNLNALHIPEIILGTNFWSRARRLERSFYSGTVIDGARFFHKETFIKSGGFDESLNGPEDWDLDKKIKRIGTIGLLDYSKKPGTQFPKKMENFIRLCGVDPNQHPSVIYHNESELNLRQYLKKKNYYAKSFETYIKKWGKEDSDIKKQFGFGYRYFGVFLEKNKWKLLLRNPVEALGLFILRVLVGILFLRRKFYGR